MKKPDEPIVNIAAESWYKNNCFAALRLQCFFRNLCYRKIGRLFKCHNSVASFDIQNCYLSKVQSIELCGFECESKWSISSRLLGVIKC